MSAALVADLALERGAARIAAAFDVRPGRPLGLVGPNGAGKSSILGAMAGLVPADGSLRVGPRELMGLPPERRGVGVVFQDLLLFRHLDVRDNVAFAQRLRIGRRRARVRAAELLQLLGLADLADRYPHELSGGQAQRVAVARALAAEPDVLLLDEPMAALDVELRDGLRRELGERLRGLDIPVVVVTHSRRDLEALADDVVVLEAGRVTQRGSLAVLRAAPATPYVSRLVGGRESESL
ncbi:ATP-binding cassette domain-containing protein [Pseudolysinimonas sp.]|uniref:ATP-binding cassette domain-containing protein n=1 Tax=Pseudolysinimonas sp. TaxID=2680009 RepID=UPI003F801BF4